jgi:hypothetical protein
VKTLHHDRYAKISIWLLSTAFLCGSIAAEESRHFGMRLGGDFLWGPDFYFCEGKQLQPKVANTKWPEYRDTVSFSSSPLFGVHLFFLFPVDLHVSLELGPEGHWKETRETFYFIDPATSGFEQTIIKFNYWSVGPEVGIYYIKELQRFRIRAGVFGLFAFSGWASNVDNYDENGVACKGDDFWGNGGCIPFGLGGDRKTNTATGFELGGGIKAGGEYIITRHLSFNLELLFRFSRSYVEFIPDFNIFEETGAYQDYLTEIMLDKEIDENATFSVIPSTFGLSTGLTCYF